MIRRHVLAALAHGISKDDDLAARAALGHIDPVLRGAARKRLGRVLVDAELASSTAGIHAPSRAHVQRLAALALAGRDAGAVAGDPDAAIAEYARLPAARAPRFPIVTLVTTLALLAVGAGVALFLVFSVHHAKSRTYVKPMPAPSATAYREGGVPLHDAALDALFGTQLTDLVVHLNHDPNGTREVQALRATPLHHGGKLDAAWQHAIDAFQTAVTTPDAPQDPLREAVRELTEELGKVGQGYFLEGRIRRGYPLVQAYRVEEIVFVVAGGAPRRVLSLRRLDHLNTGYAVLGMHDEDAGDPVLHLDRIDEHVATVELPVLAPNALYPVAEDGWMPTPEARALATAIGTAIRAEYAAALGGDDAAAASRIATLLAERGAIVDEWRSHLDRKNIVFVATDDLFLPADLLPSLEHVVPHYQQERVEAIEAELADLEAPRIHDRVRTLVAATVRRHEAEHGFDYDRDTELRYPAALADRLGPPHDDEGNEIAIVRSARAELSGYLSQIINDAATPQSSLWHLGRQVFTRDRWGTGEFYAGVVILEGLARHLGAEVPAWRRFDRETFAKTALLVASASDVKLRDAAKALWTELYGEPPTTIVDQPPRSVIATAG